MVVAAGAGAGEGADVCGPGAEVDWRNAPDFEVYRKVRVLLGVADL